ncbi:MAG: aspartate kinase [Christensenellaceae bacterium]|jgi:aspartate kinase|nr:aspartate kinase [Christensenellaceae bacterium]
MKVCKFGGTSMASADSIRLVKSIIESDPLRKFVVVSAPGKRFKSDRKITDLLYDAYSDNVKFGAVGSSLSEVSDRFSSIASELNIDIDIDSKMDEIEQEILKSSSPDYAASRGEYLCALVTAAYLNYQFVDAGELIKFRSNGTFDPETTKDHVCQLLSLDTGVVIPGFYGRMPDKTIKTFSRGGSDVTGAIIAYAINATVYENWTDVDGFMAVDPVIVAKPKQINYLSYTELRELSYMGAKVMHPDSVFPILSNGIPINIKNTFNPENEGTWILKSVENFERPVITGITGKTNNTMITMSKSMMNTELGFGRKVLSCLERNGVGFDHIPTGIDTMSVVIEGRLDDALMEKLVSDINRSVAPDTIEIEYLALIAVVGHGMAKRKGTAAKICSALYNADINIIMIDQGSSEMNVIVGVDNSDYECAVTALYSAFFQ